MNHDRRPRSTPRSTLLAALLAAALPAAAGAEVFTVDRFDDNASSSVCSPVLPNDCSLRGDVRAANANGVSDTIVLPDGLYQLTLAGANEDFALTGDLDVRGPLAVQAAPGAHPVIEQTVGDRMFHSSVVFFTGSFSLLGPMTLIGGTIVSINEDGGSIYADRSGSLTLTDVTIAGGTADDGGCIYFADPAAAAALTLTDVLITGCAAGRRGGGMYVAIGDTTVTLTRVVIEDNHADDEGGGLRLFAGGGPGATVILESILRDNSAGNVANGEGFGGGAIITSSPVALLRSTVSGNQAGGPAAHTGQGGGLFIENSTVLIQNSTVSGNRALGASFGTGTELELLGSIVSVEFSTIAAVAGPAFESIRTGFDSALLFEASIVQARCFDVFDGSLVSNGLNAEKPIDGAASTTCGLTHVSDVFTTAPLLRPLAGYGGPTPTHALLEGAPALLPAVPADNCNDPVGGPIDQRSAPRTLLFCEPGSYEHGADAPGPWIFSDGFESGDTAAWSSAVP